MEVSHAHPPSTHPLGVLTDRSPIKKFVGDIRWRQKSTSVNRGLLVLGGINEFAQKKIKIKNIAVFGSIAVYNCR